MIDKIHLSQHIELIPINIFGTSDFKYVYNDDNSYYYNRFNNIQVSYYINSSRLYIKGRLVNISVHPNRLDNLDEYYMGAAGI